MCKYCSEDNTESNLKGHDHIVHDKVADFYYIFVNFGNGKMCKILVNYCPRCGRQFKRKTLYSDLSNDVDFQPTFREHLY